MKFLIIILSVKLIFITCNQLEHIKPETSENTQASAALDVIKRLIGEKAENVAIKINFDLPRNSFKIRKTNNTDTLRIEASSGVAACKAFAQYLKHYSGVHISWDGNQLETFTFINEFPPGNIEMRASSQIIYYQNVCTHSYSFAWWKWTDWRKHLDWMALTGITLALAPFQEDIWTDIYSDYGMNQSEIDAHLGGVGFLSWQRMGNIVGWGGPLRRNFINFASQLQLKMIKSMNELGMSVALPAFDGHLPIAFSRIFPNVRFTTVGCWNDFASNYCCPLFLDPTEPLFQEIGRKFLQKQTQKYGTNHIYFSDPFNEVQPYMAEANYLRNVSKSIYSAMKSIDDKAIWLLQAWFLVNSENLWTDDLIEAFLTAVPKGNILVLDLQSEQHPQYKRTKSFYGQPFIWCMLHNFGGTLGMHGSIKIVNLEIPRAHQMENSSLVGVGITPEGIHQNYVVYEFALEKAWKYAQINHKKWLKYYAKARYGYRSENIEHGWMLLLKSVYAFKGMENIRGKYTICRRPSLKLKQLKWYDEKLVQKALEKFLTAATNESFPINKLFERDMVDLTRQFLQNEADKIYLIIVDAFKKQNLDNFLKYSELFKELLRDIESILGTHNDFLLGNFLKAAKSLASDELERKQFEFNARNQITLWGPNGEINDYATKQWNGIVIDYYLPRWTLFFDQLKRSLKFNIPFNQSKFQMDVFKDVEMPFNQDDKIYATVADGNSVLRANALYIKWAT